MKNLTKRQRKRLSSESLVVGRALGAAIGGTGLSQLYGNHHLVTALSLFAIAAYTYIGGLIISMRLDDDDDDESKT